MIDEKVRALFMAIIVLAWAIVAWTAQGASIFTDRYDGLIQEATDRWWKDYPDWRDWKAQLHQESRLDPNAESPVGAVGLAQFMPGTWTDIERALYSGAHISRTLAGPAIDGGAYYVSSLRRAWRSPRPLDDRQRLAQASYNAGAGNIVKAQKLCAGSILWAEIAPCLPRVTGSDNAAQTVDYVIKIARWRSMM